MFSRIKRAIIEFKELKYLAHHDSLTGLLNRNWLHKNIDTIKSNYVYFIDINDLRKANQKGHMFGDEHIKKIINSISLNSSDILIRYAGDEFILLSDTNNVISTNHLFSVGIAENKNDLLKAINNANIEMIKSKRLWKKQKCKK